MEFSKLQKGLNQPPPPSPRTDRTGMICFSYTEVGNRRKTGKREKEESNLSNCDNQEERCVHGPQPDNGNRVSREGERDPRRFRSETPKSMFILAL